MGGQNYRDCFEAFLEAIPYNKLEEYFTAGTQISDENFRLDMQGITTENKEWNLQIQVDKSPKCQSLKSLAFDTIAGPVLVDPKNPISPEEIKKLFRERLIKRKTPEDLRQEKMAKKAEAEERRRLEKEKAEEEAKKKKGNNKRLRR
ncbi:hypothetical protein V8F20_005208 [Naviculisporaceae sp. PSN 640]